MADSPLVSTVIPTFQRPALVVRAVQSALAQTCGDIEVVVAIDGPDAETAAALGRLGDARVRILASPRRLGPGASRNCAVAAARAPWVAFLDDDDTWEPEKIERQLVAAGRSESDTPILSCRLRARCRAGESLWPRRRPRAGESVGDYLFVRGTLFGMEGVLQTSTLLTRRDLLLRFPFREDMWRSEDLEWLLRATHHGAAGVEFADWPRPLVTWNIDDDRPRLSLSAPWHQGLDFIRANRSLVSRRAYASYLLTWVSVDAARQGTWRDFLLLWREAWRHGRPSPLDALLHLGHWVLPRAASRRLALSAAREPRS